MNALRLIVGCIFLVIVSEARAQAACGPRDAIAKGLAEKYGETLMFTAKTGAGHRLEFFLNAATGTWTAIVGDAAVTCVQAAGNEFTAGAMIEGQGT